jgi:hypothetical protein
LTSGNPLSNLFKASEEDAGLPSAFVSAVELDCAALLDEGAGAQLLFLLKQEKLKVPSGRVADPDPYPDSIGSVDPDPDPGGQK